MDLVILAGGKGSRIKHLNQNKPKPMIKIGKKIFLELLINHYAKFNWNDYFLQSYSEGLLFEDLLMKFHHDIL